MQAGREGNVEAVEDEDGQKHFLEQKVTEFPQVPALARKRDDEERQEILGQHEQQHDVHVLDEGVRVADGPYFLRHDIVGAAGGHVSSTDDLRTEFVRAPEIAATLHCVQYGLEVEPVDEPPVQERTEIEIDEIVVGQVEVGQLQHSEELQTDDFAIDD